MAWRECLRRCNHGYSPNISKSGGDLQSQPTETNRCPAAETRKKSLLIKGWDKKHEDLYEKSEYHEDIDSGPCSSIKWCSAGRDAGLRLPGHGPDVVAGVSCPGLQLSSGISRKMFGEEALCIQNTFSHLSVLPQLHFPPTADGMGQSFTENSLHTVVQASSLVCLYPPVTVS